MGTWIFSFSVGGRAVVAAGGIGVGLRPTVLPFGFIVLFFLLLGP